eukprot:scaffold33618_cov101-Isochrysis_galbana.AAC.2
MPMSGVLAAAAASASACIRPDAPRPDRYRSMAAPRRRPFQGGFLLFLFCFSGWCPRALATRKLDRTRSFSRATRMVCRAGLASRALLLPRVSPASRREPPVFPVMFPLVVFLSSLVAAEEAVTLSSVSPMVGGVLLPLAFFFPP